MQEDNHRFEQFINNFKLMSENLNKNISENNGMFINHGVIFNQNEKDAILTEQAKKASLGQTFKTPDGSDVDEVVDKMIRDILENL